MTEATRSSDDPPAERRSPESRFEEFRRTHRLEALGPVLRRLHAVLQRYFRRRNADVREELAQESIFRLLHAIGQDRFDSFEQCRRYLSGIARNLDRRLHAARGLLSLPDVELTDATSGQSNDAIGLMVTDEESPSRLIQALDRLRPEERTILALRYIDGLSRPAIGARLGISLGCVRTRLYRARKRLIDRIEPHGP